MGTEYRAAARTCPSCREVLDEVALAGAQVDVCPRCRGVWIDWMDGDLASIAQQADDLPRDGVAGSETGGPCPLCAAPLHRELRRETLIFRCGSCAGAFVPRGSIDALARDHAELRQADPNLWEALVAWLQRALR